MIAVEFIWGFVAGILLMLMILCVIFLYKFYVLIEPLIKLMVKDLKENDTVE